MNVNQPCTDSPFFKEASDGLILITLPPKRCMAAWNEHAVRVLDSKNINAKTFP